jgi:hypothetical protein
MSTEWVVVDKLVHELGSLRAVVQEIEAHPGLDGEGVVVELRGLLDRAADTVHLVVGGDEAMISKAWQCIAEAREVGDRARRALDHVRATHRESNSLRDMTRALKQDIRTVREEADAQVLRGKQRVDELKRIRQGAPRPGAAAAEKRPKT